MLETQRDRANAIDGVEDDIHLIYKIEGEPNEIDIFELSRVLVSLGKVLREGNRLANPQTDLQVRVKPFEEGSFIVDLALHVQQNPAYLAFIGHPEFLKQAKEVLEYLGLIKKVGEAGASLMELLRKLGNGKPAKVEKTGDKFEYHAADGGTIEVSSPVHNLYNNGVVNHYTYNFAAPAERTGVTGVKTYLRDAEEQTGVEISKTDVPAIKAYSAPELLKGKVEILENTNVYMLHPKSGNYGETKGKWTFRIAGTKRTMKAKITDAEFLATYTVGDIRFYAQDLLKASVYEKQTVDGTKVKVENEIVKVLEYRPAHPSERR